MHYDLIFITNSLIESPLLDNFNYLILDETHYLRSDYFLNNGITFDYAIIKTNQALKNIDILRDNQKIVTNYFLQTSKEHLFYIGKENYSKLSESEQIKRVLDFLT